ncbi:MAG: bifunctional aspartate kinase/homoserine dehydrogenase I [Woeseiaceae bacterium]|nr:bifunctional aspartate kinase/homoserine dehydrogenase I [Woeseiaceae bacterium]
MKSSRWKVHKFGGTSLSDAHCFAQVGAILSQARAEEADVNLAVIVSAMGGMTNHLLDLSNRARLGDPSWQDELAVIGERYMGAVREVVSPDTAQALESEWQRDAEVVAAQLGEISRVKSAPRRRQETIAGYGELWSARLLAAQLAGSEGGNDAGHWIDARELIVVRQGELGPQVLWEQTRSLWRDQRDTGIGGIVVVTGFNALDEDGLPTTLGRNGSDYTAAILASLTDAESLTIWTDVDGVLSGDPRRIPDAHVIDALSYDEAMDLAYFGAKVIHPQTMGPIIEKQIPVFIRNTFRPELEGSRIEAGRSGDSGIKGVTAIDDMAIINVEGAGMIGVPGTADRLFAALRGAGVSVTLISQASSEHSICVAVPQTLAETGRRVIASAFAEELEAGQIQRIDVVERQSILAVVGDNMAGLPGVAGRFFSTLGAAGVNIRAIAQGSSERNISAVVDSQDAERALRAVHSGFYLSAKTLSIGLLGAGNVGREFLRQLGNRTEWLRERFNLDLRVRAIGRSQSMLLAARRIELADWQSAFESDAEPIDLQRFEAHVQADHLPHAVIIDCTASDDVAARYAGWLASGIHVVTPNKKAFSGPSAYYRELKDSARRGGSHYYYETTVGAALPIIGTIRKLLDTGDRIHSIDGILSGTLAYLFNVYDGSTPFSAIVRAARDAGYTEPDPRDDLSGMDVARKLTILARELDVPVELGDFPVDNLVPPPLRDLETDAFLDRLSDHDDDMRELYEAAARENCRLRYVASLDEDGGLQVGLRRVPADSALSHVALTDNVVRFKSDRYRDNRLVVQGPGAGPAVTAGGVFGDLLDLARHLDGLD